MRALPAFAILPLAACQMDMATFEVDPGDRPLDGATIAFGSDEREMECADGLCTADWTIDDHDMSGRIVLSYADGAEVECDIPTLEFGYSDTMRFSVDGATCSEN